MEIWEYVLIFLSVCFAGIVDSIAGGGGLITIPTYIALGVPREFILGTNKCVSTLGGVVAITRYIREKRIFWNFTLPGIILGLIGSFIGAACSRYLSTKHMVYILLLVVPIILGLNFYKKELGQNEGDYSCPSTKDFLKMGLISFIIGGYDGFFGPGTGSFLLFSFVLFLHMNFAQASANARIINFTSNIAALIFFLFAGAIHWQIALVGIGGSMTGNFIGSGLMIKKGGGFVRKVFIIVLTALLIKSIHQVFF